MGDSGTPLRPRRPFIVNLSPPLAGRLRLKVYRRVCSEGLRSTATGRYA
jgi:hypothetical protein